MCTVSTLIELKFVVRSSTVDLKCGLIYVNVSSASFSSPNTEAPFTQSIQATPVVSASDSTDDGKSILSLQNIIHN